MHESFYFQAAGSIEASYIYKLQLTTTHKFRRYNDKKTEAKKPTKNKIKNKIK